MVGVREDYVESAAAVDGKRGKNVSEDRRANGGRINKLERPGGAAIGGTGNMELSFGAVEKNSVDVAVVRIDGNVSLVARLDTDCRGGNRDGSSESDATIDGFNHQDALGTAQRSAQLLVG